MGIALADESFEESIAGSNLSSGTGPASHTYASGIAATRPLGTSGFGLYADTAAGNAPPSDGSFAVGFQTDTENALTLDLSGTVQGSAHAFGVDVIGFANETIEATFGGTDSGPFHTLFFTGPGLLDQEDETVPSSGDGQGFDQIEFWGVIDPETPPSLGSRFSAMASRATTSSASSASGSVWTAQATGSFPRRSSR